MNELPIAIELHDATESSVMLSLAFHAESAMPVDYELYGPLCAYAKTLPSMTASRLMERERRIEFLITEPCYWTPQLPFLYDLTSRTKGDCGIDNRPSRSLGLRRLVAHGRNLRLNGERIVLRGASGDGFHPQTLLQARSADAALIAPYGDEALFDAAARIGVLLIATVATHADALQKVLEDLSWRPAAALALVDRAVFSQNASRAARRMNLLLAQRMQAAEAPDPKDVEAAADVVAVELAAEERPPSWIASLGKPVIAIRRGGAYANVQEARAACDRLQAELAPEFDLAGYFA